MFACLKNSLPYHIPWHFSASHILHLPFAPLHCLRLHRPHCTGRESGFPSAPLRGWADRLAEWPTPHNSHTKALACLPVPAHLLRLSCMQAPPKKDDRKLQGRLVAEMCAEIPHLSLVTVGLATFSCPQMFSNVLCCLLHTRLHLVLSSSLTLTCTLWFGSSTSGKESQARCRVVASQHGSGATLHSDGEIEPNERLQGDFSEPERMLTADETLATELAQSCDSRSSERKLRQKSMTEELPAIHATIKLLNDDDVLELFKGTLMQALQSTESVDQTPNEAQVSGHQVSGHRDATADLFFFVCSRARTASLSADHAAEVIHP